MRIFNYTGHWLTKRNGKITRSNCIRVNSVYTVLNLVAIILSAKRCKSVELAGGKNRMPLEKHDPKYNYFQLLKTDLSSSDISQKIK